MSVEASPRWHVAAGAIAVFLVALTPRVVDHERFVTIDEGLHWFPRTEQFVLGLTTGDLALTNQAPHPGVTTMWCGAIGTLAWDLTHDGPPVGRIEENAFRNTLRWPVAVLTALGAAVGYALMRRLLPPTTAALAALWWALDPYLAAHGRILHTDALVTTFMAVSLLAALAAHRERPLDRRMWALSAIAGGLALLTKISAVIALPLIALIAAADVAPAIFADGSADATRMQRARAVAKAVAPRLAAWAGVSALVWIALFPGVWVDPIGVAANLVWGVELGASPHESGNYFLGDYVENPGLWFYPVAIALRLTPWTAIGAAIGTVLAVRRRDAATWFAVITAVMLVFFTISLKKLDRYALPLFPFLDALAAVGWIGVAELVWGARRPIPAWLGPAGIGVAGGISATYLASVHSYELATYNPMFGGIRTAERSILVGWGEGLEDVGDWLQVNGSCADVVASAQPAPLQPFSCASIVPLSQANGADWVVLYVNQVQRDLQPAITHRYLGRVDPDYVVAHDGTPLAWVFRGPRYGKRNRVAPPRHELVTP